MKKRNATCTAVSAEASAGLGVKPTEIDKEIENLNALLSGTSKAFVDYWVKNPQDFTSENLIRLIKHMPGAGDTTCMKNLLFGDDNREIKFTEFPTKELVEGLVSCIEAAKATTVVITSPLNLATSMLINKLCKDAEVIYTHHSHGSLEKTIGDSAELIQKEEAKKQGGRPSGKKNGKKKTTHQRTLYLSLGMPPGVTFDPNAVFPKIGIKSADLILVGNVVSLTGESYQAPLDSFKYGGSKFFKAVVQHRSIHIDDRFIGGIRKLKPDHNFSNSMVTLISGFGNRKLQETAKKWVKNQPKNPWRELPPKLKLLTAIQFKLDMKNQPNTTAVPSLKVRLDQPDYKGFNDFSVLIRKREDPTVYSNRTLSEAQATSYVFQPCLAAELIGALDVTWSYGVGKGRETPSLNLIDLVSKGAFQKNAGFITMPAGEANRVELYCAYDASDSIKSFAGAYLDGTIEVTKSDIPEHYQKIHGCTHRFTFIWKAKSEDEIAASAAADADADDVEPAPEDTTHTVTLAQLQEALTKPIPDFVKFWLENEAALTVDNVKALAAEMPNGGNLEDLVALLSPEGDRAVQFSEFPTKELMDSLDRMINASSVKDILVISPKDQAMVALLQQKFPDHRIVQHNPQDTDKTFLDHIREGEALFPTDAEALEKEEANEKQQKLILTLGINPPNDQLIGALEKLDLDKNMLVGLELTGNLNGEAPTNGSAVFTQSGRLEKRVMLHKSVCLGDLIGSQHVLLDAVYNEVNNSKSMMTVFALTRKVKFLDEVSNISSELPISWRHMNSLYKTSMLVNLYLSPLNAPIACVLPLFDQVLELGDQLGDARVDHALETFEHIILDREPAEEIFKSDTKTLDYIAQTLLLCMLLLRLDLVYSFVRDDSGEIQANGNLLTLFDPSTVKNEGDRASEVGKVMLDSNGPKIVMMSSTPLKDLACLEGFPLLGGRIEVKLSDNNGKNKAVIMFYQPDAPKIEAAEASE